MIRHAPLSSFTAAPRPALAPDTAPSPASPWIDFQDHGDGRGGLVVAEGSALPFVVRRIYWLHDLTGAKRGGHAHRRLWQIMIPLSGALTLRLTCARGSRRHRLFDPRRGLLIGPMTWRVLDSIEPGTNCLVLASEPYDEADYIRDPDAFRRTLLAAEAGASDDPRPDRSATILPRPAAPATAGQDDAPELVYVS